MILVLEDCQSRIDRFVKEIPSAICRGFSIDIIKILAGRQGTLELLCLDYDVLGEKQGGIKVVKWIIKNRPQINEIVIHTMNHLGGIKMKERLDEAGYNVKRIPFVEIVWRELLI